jgi:hypothetical protein
MLEIAVLALAAVARQTPTGDTSVVRGVVFDSIASHPLVGASVQLVRADSGSASRVFAATTDSSGHFVVRGVPAGRYVAGFFHPMLDTLGLQLRERVVDLAMNSAPIVLATPSPRTIVRGLCGDSSSAVRQTLLFGHVYETRTESAAENASVVVTWAEAAQTSSGLDFAEQSARETTRRAGLFALCGVPADAALQVRVAGAGDSAFVKTRIPSSGILHLTLFIGATGATGRIVGQVSDRAKNPVRSARVSAGGREATVSSAGRFVLDSVPTGSRSIDVRSIGFAPISLLVNVAEGRDTNLDVALERIVALPTTETRAAAAADHLAQYLQTKRTDPTGARFIEPTRLPGYPATQSACALVSILRNFPVCRQLENCDAFFLNGTRVFYELSDLDDDDILGVEVFGKIWPAIYRSYQLVRTPITCGVVVFTRCPGIELRCGDNPASQPIRRPNRHDQFRREYLGPWSTL